MVEERRRGVRDKRTIGGGAPPSSLGSFAYSTAAMAAAPSGWEGGGQWQRAPQLRPFNARPKKSNAKERRTMRERGEAEAR